MSFFILWLSRLGLGFLVGIFYLLSLFLGGRIEKLNFLWYSGLSFALFLVTLFFLHKLVSSFKKSSNDFKVKLDYLNPINMDWILSPTILFTLAQFLGYYNYFSFLLIFLVSIFCKNIFRVSSFFGFLGYKLFRVKIKNRDYFVLSKKFIINLNKEFEVIKLNDYILVVK